MMLLSLFVVSIISAILIIKKNFFSFNSNLLKITIIFFIGFITRFMVNYCFNVNVFTDYLNIISILYYFNLSTIVVYINQCDLNINLFKLIINWDSITYNNMLNGIRHIIYGFINNHESNKITMN